ncbi:hypothetical protein GCM10018987_60980 [Streptomyces cremeus]
MPAGVGGDDAVGAGECGDLGAPHAVVEETAVQQDHGGPVAAGVAVDEGAALGVEGAEFLELCPDGISHDNQGVMKGS